MDLPGFSSPAILSTLSLLASLLVLAGQGYWALVGYRFFAGRFRAPRARVLAFTALAFLYLALLLLMKQALQHPGFGPKPNSTRLGLGDVGNAFAYWWLIGSTVAFLVALPIRLLTRVAVRPQPGRRHFLEHCATGIVAAPFAATAYAILRGRVDLEVVRTHAPIARLPAQFSGFRIVQLSDIHISPFMEAWQIREFAEVTNSLRPNMIVLTGDFVCWDATVVDEVVGALSGLRAPFGVFACLGNHEAWTGAKDSITASFERAGVNVLRDSRRRIRLDGAAINMIGIEPDYGWSTKQIPAGLALPDTPNILLSHYPDVFDHAAANGIDLTLSGHTHGGQVKVNYVTPHLLPSKTELPYLSGWFERPGGRLYVNRGIGTIFVPVRFGMTPEITVFELQPVG
jgi:predicted MPP superfamily phosphohydrolase